MADLELGDDYDEYVEALPDSKLVSVSMVLPGKQLREVKRFCDENGYSLGQGLRILLLSGLDEDTAASLSTDNV